MRKKQDEQRKGLDELYREAGKYRNSSELKELYEFIKNFPRIAPYNAFLLHVQRPGCVYVASAEEWRTKFNRGIKPSALPLVILRSFGPVSFVFDVGDTEGNGYVPERLLRPFHAHADSPLAWETVEAFVRNLLPIGIRYIGVMYGSGMAGNVRVINPPYKIRLPGRDPAREKSVLVFFEIRVNKALSSQDTFATIVHELGHLACGHLGCSDTGWWPHRGYVPKNTREFEAESVAWLVCRRLGIDPHSEKYLSSYFDEGGELPYLSLETILKAVGKIEQMLPKALREVDIDSQYYMSRPASDVKDFY